MRDQIKNEADKVSLSVKSLLRELMSNSGVLGGQRMSRSPHLAPPNYILTLLYVKELQRGMNVCREVLCIETLTMIRVPSLPG